MKTVFTAIQKILLKEADLIDLFQINEVVLFDEELADFDDKEYILYHIEKELNMQFNTRKQMLLKTIYVYIDHSGSLYDIDSLSMFGTNNFNLIWENICADIMDNQLDTQLGALKLPVPLKAGYVGRKRLIELIEKPKWSITGKEANDTLIPDLITISKTADEYQFVIFDAKYYNALLEPDETPKAQPGIESVTKQYLYQLAYQKFIEDHEFNSVRNCFLMPTESNEIIDKGEVSMDILGEIGLESIKVRFLPAEKAYDHYLSSTKMKVSEGNKIKK